MGVVGNQFVPFARWATLAGDGHGGSPEQAQPACSSAQAVTRPSAELPESRKSEIPWDRLAPVPYNLYPSSS
jgi:hypothetical protein